MSKNHDTAAALAAALRDNPGSPSTVLAAVAGIGKSTAAKLLAAWEKEGFAVRNAEGKGAAAWALAEVAPEPQPEPAPVVEAPVAEVPEQRKASEPTGAVRPVGSVGKGGLVVLGRGGLRAEVLDYMADNDGEHTPAKVAKALGGRSGGAVQKVMVKLVAEGVAVQTSDKPKTYVLAVPVNA